LRYFYTIFFLLFFNTSTLFAEQLTDSFRLDGYINIDMVSSDRNQDDFKPSGGFQGRYQISENISATGQIHFNEGQNSNNNYSNSLKDYDSELKWLYIDYSFKEDITLRAGAFQFPVFKSSETGDIGYTYTWTETPLRYYGVFGCDDFEGGEILKNFSYKDFDFLAQLSFGKSQNTLNAGQGEDNKGDVDDLIGFTLKTSHENFILNAGYLQANSTIDVGNAPIEISPNVSFNMYALESEIYINDSTIKSGLIKTNLSNVFPDELHYYSSLEHNIDDFTPYILYSKESSKFKLNTADTNTPMNIQKEIKTMIVVIITTQRLSCISPLIFSLVCSSSLTSSL
jgi:hypothetical protein